MAWIEAADTETMPVVEGYEAEASGAVVAIVGPISSTSSGYRGLSSIVVAIVVLG